MKNQNELDEFDDDPDYTEEEIQFHVAWADRLGVPKLWFEIIRDCNRFYKTKLYPRMVEKLRTNLVDIAPNATKPGPKLKSITERYIKEKLTPEINEEFNEWLDRNDDISHNESFIRDKRNQLTMKKAIKIYKFIFQLFETKGFMFYRRENEGQYEKM